MGKILAPWLVGLISVGSMAGCGFLRNFGDDRGQQPAPCTQGKTGATCQEIRPDSGRPAEKSACERIERPARMPTPSLPDAIQPPQRNPVAAPSFTPPQQPTKDKATARAEETPIVNRPPAALTNRSATKVADPPRTTTRPVGPTIVNSDAAPSLPKLPPVTPTPFAVVAEKAKAGTADLEKEKTATIKKRADIVSGPADNYKTITGRVYLFRKTVRVRYAAVDQEDPYGGSVVLDGGSELSKLRDGQYVRVRGELIPPSDRTGSAVCRVLTIDVLD